MRRNRFGKLVYVGDLSTGHGTDVLNLAQQHALLAIRGFGHYQLKPGYRDNLVALMDITPTLLWTLGIKANEPMQGVPLDVLGNAAIHERTLYFMSGLYFPGLGSGNLNLAANLAEKAKLYRIRRNGRLVVRKDTAPASYRIQNLAAFNGKLIVAELWNIQDQYFTAGVVNVATGEQYPMNAKTLLMPGVADIGYDFCQHFGTNNPYFTKPAFCDAIVTK